MFSSQYLCHTNPILFPVWGLLILKKTPDAEFIGLLAMNTTL